MANELEKMPLGRTRHDRALVAAALAYTSLLEAFSARTDDGRRVLLEEATKQLRRATWLTDAMFHALPCPEVAHGLEAADND